MTPFLIALQFLTIIPITLSAIPSDKHLGYSALFYPVIGLMIGAVLVIFAQLFSTLPIQIEAAILLTLWILLTGGLHLDGLADCADAWVGGLGSKERSLQIMKDPAAGPVAVIVLVLVLLLKWTTIDMVLEKQQLFVLLFAPMLGRISILILMLITRYIRVGGIGEKISANCPQGIATSISFFGVLGGLFFLGFLPIALMLIMLFMIRYFSSKRLGGTTGDVYGATVELVETSILLGVTV